MSTLHFSGVSLHFSDVTLHFSAVSLHFSDVSLPFNGVSLHFRDVSLHFTGVSKLLVVLQLYLYCLVNITALIALKHYEVSC